MNVSEANFDKDDGKEDDADGCTNESCRNVRKNISWIGLA